MPTSAAPLLHGRLKASRADHIPAASLSRQSFPASQEREFQAKRPRRPKSRSAGIVSAETGAPAINDGQFGAFRQGSGNLRKPVNAWWRTQSPSNLSPSSNSRLTGNLTGITPEKGYLSDCSGWLLQRYQWIGVKFPMCANGKLISVDGNSAGASWAYRDLDCRLPTFPNRP